MAGSGDNGASGNEHLEVLRAIWQEMKTLNGRTTRMHEDLKAEIAELRGEVAGLRTETHDGFKRLDKRIDHILVGGDGEEHREFRERIARLEAHAGLPPPPGGEPT